MAENEMFLYDAGENGDFEATRQAHRMATGQQKAFEQAVNDVLNTAHDNKQAKISDLMGLLDKPEFKAIQDKANQVMLLFTTLRNIGAFSEMIDMYNRVDNQKFKNASLVLGQLASACIKTNPPRLDLAEEIIQKLNIVGDGRGTDARAKNVIGDVQTLLADRATDPAEKKEHLEQAIEAYKDAFWQDADFIPGVKGVCSWIALGGLTDSKADLKAAVYLAGVVREACRKEAARETRDYLCASDLLICEAILGHGTLGHVFNKLMNFDVADWQFKETRDILSKANETIRSPMIDRVIKRFDIKLKDYPQGNSLEDVYSLKDIYELVASGENTPDQIKAKAQKLSTFFEDEDNDPLKTKTGPVVDANNPNKNPKWPIKWGHWPGDADDYWRATNRLEALCLADADPEKINKSLLKLLSFNAPAHQLQQTRDALEKANKTLGFAQTTEVVEMIDLRLRKDLKRAYDKINAWGKDKGENAANRGEARAIATDILAKCDKHNGAPKDYSLLSNRLEALCILGDRPAEFKKALEELLAVDAPDWRLQETRGALDKTAQRIYAEIKNKKKGPLWEQYGRIREAIGKLDTKLGNRAEHSRKEKEAEDKATFEKVYNGSNVKDKDAVAIQDKKHRALVGDSLVKYSYSYAGSASSNDGSNIIGGNLRHGGQLPDHSVSQRDIDIFKLLLQTPYKNLFPEGECPNIQALGIEGFDETQPLSALKCSGIDETSKFLKLVDALIRYHYGTNNFANTGLNMEDNAEINNSKYDRTVSALLSLFGKEKEDRPTFSRTNVLALFIIGSGDCRHHANTKQIFFDVLRENQINECLQVAHGRASSADLLEKKDVPTCVDVDGIDEAKKIQQWEVRTFDVCVNTPVKLKDGKMYNPEKTNDKKYRVNTDKKGNYVNNCLEEHTQNLLIKWGDNGLVEEVFICDSFYQNRYDWQMRKIDPKEIKVDKNTGAFSIPAGYLDPSKVQGGVKDCYITLTPTVYSGKRDDPSKSDIAEDVSMLGIPVEKLSTYEGVLYCLQHRNEMKDNLNKMREDYECLEGQEHVNRKTLEERLVAALRKMGIFKMKGPSDPPDPPQPPQPLQSSEPHEAPKSSDDQNLPMAAQQDNANTKLEADKGSEKKDDKVAQDKADIYIATVKRDFVGDVEPPTPSYKTPAQSTTKSQIFVDPKNSGR